MKIYLLKRIDGPDYDEYDEKVIRAKSEKQAREIANKNVGDEGQIWADKNLVVAEIVTAAGEPGVISDSFNAG